MGNRRRTAQGQRAVAYAAKQPLATMATPEAYAAFRQAQEARRLENIAAIEAQRAAWLAEKAKVAQ